MAVRAIPDAGPSGAIGFLAGDVRIYNLAADVGHSDFFEEGNLAPTFDDIWRRFLRNRLEDLHGVDLHATCPQWTRPNVLQRAPTLIWFGLTFTISTIAVLTYGLIILV